MHKVFHKSLLEKILLILEVPGYEVPFPRFLLGLVPTVARNLSVVVGKQKKIILTRFLHTRTRCAVRVLLDLP